jgi:hypothetical protein
LPLLEPSTELVLVLRLKTLRAAQSE